MAFMVIVFDPRSEEVTVTYEGKQTESIFPELVPKPMESVMYFGGRRIKTVLCLGSKLEVFFSWETVFTPVLGWIVPKPMESAMYFGGRRISGDSGAYWVY
jgi:hypothetical protein